MFKSTKTNKSKLLFITSITLFSMMYHFSASAENSFIINIPETVINSYAPVTVDLIAGNNKITLSNDSINNLNTPAFMKKGDTLMIIQMQGALIDNSDSPAYGNILDYNNSGMYEFITIKSVSEREIALSQPLKNNYKSSGNIQIIKVPEYNSMLITKEGTLSAMPWNGKAGGIIAVKVKDNIILNGAINASGKGFRGGQKDSKAPVNGITKYFSLSSGEGGEKGESIAGSQSTYDSFGGRYGRGAPANGGGGGNSHNAPGGGGANGDNGNIWTGFGVMCSVCEGNVAWAFDPGYINNFSMSSGGGRGGYSYSANNIDELVSAPGIRTWGGDNRRDVGGIGGRALNNIHSEKLFFGGGGGAGQENNNSGGSGGNGGGIIYIFADQVSGSGNINANGNNGEDSHKINFGDAPGGGGGGGSVVLKSNSVTGITINVRGGAGGNQYIGDIPEAEGGGGGGGGGYVSISSLGATINTNGGLGGITDSASMTKFPNNGSTDGAIGYLEILH